MRFRLVTLVGLTAIALPSCGQPKTGGSKDVVARSDDHDHVHSRGKMLLADAGKHHAALTAHLSSKEGNELDIFFETTDKDPKPAAIPHESFDAEAKTAAGEVKPLKFEAAPADERPKNEKPGACSHFVAKAGWMKPDDSLEVVARLKLDGKDVTIRWKNFNPKKYAHHED